MTILKRNYFLPFLDRISAGKQTGNPKTAFLEQKKKKKKKKKKTIK